MSRNQATTVISVSTRHYGDNLTWHHLIAIEPRLRAVERLARSAGRSWRDWERIRRAMRPLVGWYARRPELQSSEAWDVAYRHVLQVWETKR